ncbi:MAG: hypothetical protein QOI08_4436 [Actinomycetota bacterium]|nr:hypothetical protein [Actinomycetota bacterium]
MAPCRGSRRQRAAVRLPCRTLVLRVLHVENVRRMSHAKTPRRGHPIGASLRVQKVRLWGDTVPTFHATLRWAAPAQYPQINSSHA